MAKLQLQQFKQNYGIILLCYSWCGEIQIRYSALDYSKGGVHYSNADFFSSIKCFENEKYVHLMFKCFSEVRKLQWYCCA